MFWKSYLGGFDDIDDIHVMEGTCIMHNLTSSHCALEKYIETKQNFCELIYLAA